jgi:hypothetical protein
MKSDTKDRGTLKWKLDTKNAGVGH